MKYVGSKNRISKQIAPIIQKSINDNNIKLYYEPFVGGANMIDKIVCDKRVGNDLHKELIALFNQLQTGWRPPKTITEDEYNDVRLNRDKYPDYYVALVGFCATFGSKYFGGYARGFKADKVTPRDIPNEAIRNLMKQVPKFKILNLFQRIIYILVQINYIMLLFIVIRHIKERQSTLRMHLTMKHFGIGLES